MTRSHPGFLTLALAATISATSVAQPVDDGGGWTDPPAAGGDADADGPEPEAPGPDGEPPAEPDDRVEETPLGADGRRAPDAPKVRRTKGKIVVAVDKDEDVEVKVVKKRKKRPRPRSRLGAYGAFGLRGTGIAGKGAVLAGLEGALVFNHRLSLGLAGYGLASEHTFVDAPDPYYDRLSLGYGGLVLRWYPRPWKAVTPAVGVLVGGGGATWAPRFGDDEDDFYDPPVSTFFVVEPQAALYFRLHKYFRVGIEGSYRFVNGFEGLGSITKDGIDGWSAGVNFQVGVF